MSDKFKVVVAGAGPGGCIFARDLAKAGIDVTVYEKGGYETLGHDWSDAMERSALAETGFDPSFAGSLNTGTLVKEKDLAGNVTGIYEQHAYPYMEVWAPDYSCRKIVNFRYVTTVGTMIFKHYMAYPGRWDTDIFESWRSKANQLFAATMK